MMTKLVKFICWMRGHQLERIGRYEDKCSRCGYIVEYDDDNG